METVYSIASCFIPYCCCETTPSAPPVKVALEPFVKELEKNTLSNAQIEKIVDSIVKGAQLYSEEDKKFLKALLSTTPRHAEADCLYKYPAVVACLLSHYPIPSLWGPSPQEGYFFWQQIRSAWEKDLPDILMRLHQLRQTGLLSHSSLKIQKKFYEKFLEDAGASGLPFAKLSCEETRAMLQEMWEDSTLRSSLLSDPYLVLRLLPYTPLLTPQRAQELRDKWQWFIKTYEIEDEKQIPYSWEGIDFSHYSDKSLWRDGIANSPPLSLQELRRLPRLMRILVRAAPTSRSCFTHPTRDFSENFSLLFFILACHRPSPYSVLIRELVGIPDTLCFELQQSLEKTFAPLPGFKKKEDVAWFWKIALTWCFYYCASYERAQTPQERKPIKEKALELIEREPWQAIVLWWIGQIIPSCSLCTELESKKLQSSSSFNSYLYKHVFKTTISLQKCFSSWKYFLAVSCADSAKREEKINTLQTHSIALSTEDKSLVLTFANLWRNEDSENSPFISFSLEKEVVEASTLYQNVVNFHCNQPKSQFQKSDSAFIKTPSVLKEAFHIDKLLKLGENLKVDSWQENTIRIILQLRHITSEPQRAHFKISTFAPNEDPIIVFPPSYHFSKLPLEITYALLQFIPLCDHVKWCCVSKACWSVGKSQEYWRMRCAVDLKITEREEEKAWSTLYQEGYYLNRWIPSQFRKAIADHLPTFVTMAYPALCLNEEQLKQVWPTEKIDAFDETTSPFSFKWLRRLKSNQEELLKFFDHLLLGEQKSDPIYPPTLSLTSVCALAVEEHSVDPVIKKIKEASLLSSTKDEVWNSSFEKIQEEIKKGLTLRFGKQFVLDAFKNL